VLILGKFLLHTSKFRSIAVTKGILQKFYILSPDPVMHFYNRIQKKVHVTRT